MKLSEYLMQGRIINKQAKLLININLDNEESRNKGNIVTIIKENQDGTFHAEDNDWACKVIKTEFEFI